MTIDMQKYKTKENLMLKRKKGNCQGQNHKSGNRLWASGSQQVNEAGWSHGAEIAGDAVPPGT